ncbi:glycosyltransferase [Pseudomonas fluorescens]|nr:glycosyltransferase [Pseudomonas fluorescens]
MQVAEGWRDIPDSSEILVLFERNAATPRQWHTPDSVLPFSDQTLHLASLVQRDNPTNYPRSAYRLKGDADYAIVTIPRRPASVYVTDGSLDTLEVYDHVRRHYVACPADEKARSYRLPSIPHGPHGCILRILHPSDDLKLKLALDSIDPVAIIGSCLGDDPTIAQVRDDLSKLSVLAERLEATRSHLENELQNKEHSLTQYVQSTAALNALANELEGQRAEIEESYAQLSTRVACQDELIGNNARKIDALSLEKQQVEVQRAALQGRLDDVLLHEADQHLKIQELSFKLEQLNELANSLEAKRDALEVKERDHLLQLEKMANQLAQLNDLANRLEAQREALEAKEGGYLLQLEQMANQLEQLNDLANGLEAQREALAAKEGGYLLQLEQMANQLEPLNDLANGLEAQREALAAKEGGYLLQLEKMAHQLEQLNDLANGLEAQREALEVKEGGYLLQLEQIASLLEATNELANTLDARRDELEQQLRLRGQQLTALQTDFDSVQASNSHLSDRARSLELKQHEFVSTIDALESQVNQAQIIMLEYQGAIERVNVLEMEKTTLLLELESLNMEVSAHFNELAEKHREAEQLSNLSNRLESQREALEAQVTRLGQTINSLVEEKSEYQALVDALHIRLGDSRDIMATQPRKVLIVSHMYPREYNLAGGIFVHEQVKALRAQGIDARVVSGEPFWINTLNPKIIKRALGNYLAQKIEAWEEHDGVPLIRFPYVVSSLLPFQTHAVSYTHGLLQQAAWLHADFPFELIHAHTAYTDGTAGRRLASRFGLPLVITEHTGPFSTLTRTGYLRRMTQKALNAADKVISVSSALLSDIRQQVRLSPRVDAQVIANLVDTQLFRAQPKSSDGFIHLLWVGHFVPVKRVPVLLEAFAGAFRIQPLLRLRLAGSGEGLEDARALVDSLGLTHVVEFAGHADRAQLVDYYRECDFLVISSESETFGVVAIEAMSCGRPVLTTCCGGPAEIVSHPGLGKVVGMSVEALTEGMLAMTEQRANFNSKVIQKVTELKFSSASIAQEIAAVYSASIEKSIR